MIKPFKKQIYLIVVAFFLILSLVIIPNLVSAVPSPYLSGDLTGEPIGSFSNLGVVKEKIDFDFRSLKDSGQGTIKASYQIRNDGEQTSLELLFVAREIKDNSFTLDGKIVPAKIVKEPKLPDTWKPPQRISGVGGYSTSYDVSNHLRSVWKIKPIIPPGEHLLKVEYLAVPSGYAPKFRYYDYHIAYILTHVKNRDFSKGLEIEVKLPKKWQVTTSLPMNNTDNKLKASFDKIPNDYFIFSTRPYFPGYIIVGIAIIQNISIFGSLITSIFVGLVVVKIVKNRFGKPLSIAAILAFFSGSIIYSSLAILGLVFANYLSNILLVERHLYIGYRNQLGLGAVILIFLGIFISGFIAMMSGIYFYRKSHIN